MSARDRSLLALVILILVAVGGYFLIVQPEHHKADQIETRIGTAQTALSQAEAQVQSGLAAEAQYKMFARQLKSIGKAVPDDEQIPALINELQSASHKDKTGFEAVGVAGSAALAAPIPGTTAVTFPSQSFSLTFTGSYFAVANLLGTLASFVRADDKHFKANGRLISIGAVDLTPAGSTPSGSVAKAGTVTAAVTALDYDVPAALLSGSSTTGTTTP